MAKTIKIIEAKAHDGGVTKQDEIAFLEAVAASIPNESYLHGLFTKDFVNWAIRSICDDMDMDLYSSLESVREREQRLIEDNMGLSKEIDNLQKVVSDQRKRIADLVGECKEHERDNSELLSDNRELLAHRGNLQTNLNAEKEHSEGRLKEMQALQKLLIAVVDNSNEGDVKLAQILVRAWKGE